MTSFLLAQPRRDDDATTPSAVAYMGPLGHAKEFAERFGISVYTDFGMTEAPVPLASGLNPQNEASCGRPVDPVELRGATGRRARPSGTARRRPASWWSAHALPWMINVGYKNMPEATARAWRNGWFHTGDQFRRTRTATSTSSTASRTRSAGAARTSPRSRSRPRSSRIRRAGVAAVAVQNPDVAEATGDEEVKVVVVLERGRRARARRAGRVPVPRMPRYWVPRFVEYARRAAAHRVVQGREGELRTAGITSATWDRERSRMTLKREVVR